MATTVKKGNAPFVDIALPATFEDGNWTLLRPFFQQIFGNSGSNGVELTSVKKLSGGTTNKLYLCEIDISGSKKKVLLRLNGVGTETMIDRKKEMSVWQDIFLSTGQTSEVFGNFRNGCCYEFIEGAAINHSVVSNYWQAISRELGNFHRLGSQMLKEKKNSDKFVAAGNNNTNKSQAAVFHNIRSWLHQIQLQLEKIDDNSTPKQRELKKEILHQLDIPEVLQFTTDLENLSQGFRLGIVHGDLTPLNIVLVKNASTEKLLKDDMFVDPKALAAPEMQQTVDNATLRFIDYEYCALNLLAFDVANHLCEYSPYQPYQMEMFPNKAHQEKFVKNYLKYYNGGADPSDAELKNFLQQVQICAVLSNLQWSIWGFLQSFKQTIDFDYFLYGQERLHCCQEWRKKREIFSI